MKAILGIDPGLQGGLALRAPDWACIDPLVSKDGALDLAELSAWLAMRRNEIEIALIEEPLQAFGVKKRMQDLTKQWAIFGQICGVVAANRISYRTVEGRVWSKEFPHGVTLDSKTQQHERYRAIKQSRKVIAQKLFPRVDLRASERCTTAHEGMTDALLIAEYGHRLRRRGKL